MLCPPRKYNKTDIPQALINWCTHLPTFLHSSLTEVYFLGFSWGNQREVHRNTHKACSGQGVRPARNRNSCLKIHRGFSLKSKFNCSFWLGQNFHLEFVTFGASKSKSPYKWFMYCFIQWGGPCSSFEPKCIESMNRINKSNQWIESMNRINASNQWVESINWINKSSQWIESINRIDKTTQWIESMHRINESNQ